MGGGESRGVGKERVATFFHVDTVLRIVDSPTKLNERCSEKEER